MPDRYGHFGLRHTHPGLFWTSLSYCVFFIGIGSAYLLDPLGYGSSIALDDAFKYVPQPILGFLALSTGLARLYALWTNDMYLHRYTSSTGLLLSIFFLVGYTVYAISNHASVLGIFVFLVTSVTLYQMIVEPDTNPLSEK